MTRTKRLFSEANSAALLLSVQECRRAAVMALARAPIHSEGYNAINDLIDALDRITGALTGDRERFWAKLHSTPRTAKGG